MPIIPRSKAHANCAAPSLQLRTYAELNRHIVATGMDAPYRLWLLARSIDQDGRGIVSATAMDLALKSVGLNRRHLRRALAHPSATIFVTARKGCAAIEYRSLEAVCTALAVPPGRSISIPIASLSSTEGFRASLYAAWIASHDNLHMSRAKLAALWNVAQDTLRRWERLAEVEVAANIVEVAPEALEAALQHIPRDTRLVPDREDRCYTWEYKGKICYRTVNRYRCAYVRGRVGKSRKIARIVRSLPGVDHGAGTGERVFYRDEDLPGGWQQVRGASLKATGGSAVLPHGVSTVWQFNPWRPGKRREVLR